MRHDNVWDVKGQIQRETENAICIRVEGHGDVWLPFSQVEEIHRGKGFEDDWIVCSRWIAQQKGLL